MYTLKELKEKSPEEIKEINKELTKKFVKKIGIGIATTVIIHVASGFIIGKIEGRKEIEQPTEEES